MAERVEANITAGACDKCGATSFFTKWRQGGQSWLSCSNKNAAGDFCNGKPSSTEPADGRAAAQATPASGSRSKVMASVFDRMADAHAQLSALCAEAAAELGG